MIQEGAGLARYVVESAPSYAAGLLVLCVVAMLACALWAVRVSRREASGARQESREGVAWVLGEAKRLHEECEARRLASNRDCDRRISVLESRIARLTGPGMPRP